MVSLPAAMRRHSVRLLSPVSAAAVFRLMKPMIMLLPDQHTATASGPRQLGSVMAESGEGKTVWDGCPVVALWLFFRCKLPSASLSEGFHGQLK